LTVNATMEAVRRILATHRVLYPAQVSPPPKQEDEPAEKPGEKPDEKGKGKGKAKPVVGKQ